jgi:epoxyqueuosine reductase
MAEQGKSRKDRRAVAFGAELPIGGPRPTTPLAEALAASLEAAGYRHRLAPVEVAAELRETISGLRAEGLLAEAIYQQYQGYWDFTPPAAVPEPRTLIVVAWRSLPVKVRFHADTGPLEAVIPPSYLSTADRARCLEAARLVLGPAGYVVDWAALPVKLLAVRAGLAQYGRNNLAYVTGLGSYVRLGALCTDAELGAVKHKTKASMLMSCCPPCRNCHHVCPTGCIPHSGTVIDAGRCLAQVNENVGAWPEWVPARSHNSLVGCMRCQEACPANRYYLCREEVVAEFDRRETALILEDRPAEELPVELHDRLAELDMEGYSTVLGRNLLALRDSIAASSSAF